MTTPNEKQIPTPYVLVPHISDEDYIPTPLEISEFKDGLTNGFKGGEKNAGIYRWLFNGSRAVGFIPRHWAYELLESGECKDMGWIGHRFDPPVMITQYSMLPPKRRKAVRSTITK